MPCTHFFVLSFITDNHVVFFELLNRAVGDYVSSAENVAEFVAAVHFKSRDRAVVLGTVLRTMSIGSVALIGYIIYCIFLGTFID